MLPSLVKQSYDIPSLILIIVFIVLIAVFQLLNRRENDRFLRGNTEVLATTYDVAPAYDTILNQVEEWRRHPFRARRVSFAALRLGVPRFHTYQDIRPRLYRIVDRYAGVIAFELMPIEGGGTSIRITHSPGSQSIINAFKDKLPTKVPSSIGKACPSCKRIFPRSYSHCPYCAIALS